MPQAIARISKLKQGNIAASAQHSRRQRETPNADPNKANVCLIDRDAEVALEDLVRQRIGDQPIRKNAVLCVEMLLSASPEYFRPTDPAEAGYWEVKQLEQFQYAVQQWLSATYGDRIVRADLHLDEATPHVHAYLVPLDERGKLNCFGLFGDRAKLSQWQDSYAAALAPLGVTRGIRGSRATHTQVKEYYAAVTAAPDLGLDAATVRHQLADRHRALKQRDDLEQTARHLEQENQTLRQQVQQLQARMPPEGKGLSLSAVAARLGLEHDRSLANPWQRSGMDLAITGHQGGREIALCMQVKGCAFDEAVLWLRDGFGEAAAMAAIASHTQALFEAVPAPQFAAPVPDERHWQRVRAHLADDLGLPIGLLQRLHQQGLVYADAMGDAIFRQRDLLSQGVTGACRMGEDGVSQTVLGSDMQKGRFYWLRGGAAEDAVERVVVGQTPMDALALGLWSPLPDVRTMYLSADGVLPIGYLQGFSPDRVTVAINQDEAGQRLAQAARHHLPQVRQVVPDQADWVQSGRAAQELAIQAPLKGRSPASLEL
jgi:Plasmid recombination enzyme